MPSPLDDLDRYLLITADSHAGADPRGFEPFLAKKWLADFPDWVAQCEAQTDMIRNLMGGRSIAVDGDYDTDSNRSFDSARRLRETEADGVVAEVIFPNSTPPFAPSMMTELGEAGIGHDLDKRWAGIQAYNRWLADFSSQAPGRRAGVAPDLPALHRGVGAGNPLGPRERTHRRRVASRRRTRLRRRAALRGPV